MVGEVIMSLDIYLKETIKVSESCRCECCGHEHTEDYYPEVGRFNVTHSLAPMAYALGIYQAIWLPEEIEIETAKKMIPILEKALSKMMKDPEKYKAFNPDNGWGSFDGFYKFLGEYLFCCIQNPDAKIEVSR
jgi:hypothetical protein